MARRSAGRISSWQEAQVLLVLAASGRLLVAPQLTQSDDQQAPSFQFHRHGPCPYLGERHAGDRCEQVDAERLGAKLGDGIR